MRRGSTQAHVFKVDIDLTNATIYATYKQDGYIVVEKTNEDIDISKDQLTVHLTQEDTLQFNINSRVDFQIRYVTKDGVADASNIVKIPVAPILKDGVITAR